MIKSESVIRDDGVELIRTYSTENFKIRKDGTDEIYCEAVDLPEMGFTYSETNEKTEEVKEYEGIAEN